MTRIALTLFGLLSLGVMLAPSAAVAETTPGVAFHVDSDAHMNRMLRQVARHHAANPDIPVRVILIAEGVRAALEGAEDANGGSYSAQMEQLLAAGVRIFACENTLISFNWSAEDLAFGIETVPSGIAELGRLQVKEQWAYIKL